MTVKEMNNFEIGQAMKEKILEVIDKLAKGDFVQRWIPLTERRPDRSCQTVVVLTERKDIRLAYWVGYEFRHEDGLGELEEKCTHWMPLPEPPKEDA